MLCVTDEGTGKPSWLLCGREGQADEALKDAVSQARVHVAELALCAAEEGTGTPSWLLCGSEGHADEAAEPQAEERDEDGVQHFDVTPEPPKRRLSMTPPSSRCLLTANTLR